MSKRRKTKVKIGDLVNVISEWNPIDCTWSHRSSSALCLVIKHNEPFFSVLCGGDVLTLIESEFIIAYTLLDDKKSNENEKK